MASAPFLRFLPRTRLARAAALVSLLLIIALVGVGAWRTFLPGSTPTIGGGFALTDQFGKPRSDAEFRGQLMLVFFGFTNCPDICPVELQTISDALDLLAPDAAAKVTPIFITVDPVRDTPDALRAYVANFHPRLVALTGSPEEIGKVAKSYRVFYAQATDSSAPDDPAAYLMDHTAIVYLMGTDGRYLAFFSPGTAAAAMAEGLREHL